MTHFTSEYFLSLIRGGEGLSTIDEEREANVYLNSQDVRFLEVLDGPSVAHSGELKGQVHEEGVAENAVYFRNGDGNHLEDQTEMRPLITRPPRQVLRLLSNGSGNGSISHVFEEGVECEEAVFLGQEGEESDYEDIDGDPIYI